MPNFELEKLGLIIFLFFSFFIPNKMNAQKFDRKIKTIPFESNDTNKLNLDNNIFLSRRVFQYDYSVQSNAAKFLGKYALRTDHNSIFKRDGFSTSIINDSSYVLCNSDSFFVIDKLLLYVCSSTCSLPLSNDQTIISYQYVSCQDTLGLLTELTGIVEDSLQIFVHPPRQAPFEILEFCPFFDISKPYFVGKVWQRTLTIASSVVNKILDLKVENSITLQNYYSIKGNVILKNIDCLLIEADGFNDELKLHSNAKYYFNPNLGLVKMIYQFNDGNIVTFDLKTD